MRREHQKGENEEGLSLLEARKKGRLPEFIEFHADQLAEEEEFIGLLERMERDKKIRRSGYQK